MSIYEMDDAITDRNDARRISKLTDKDSLAALDLMCPARRDRVIGLLDKMEAVG